MRMNCDIEEIEEDRRAIRFRNRAFSVSLACGVLMLSVMSSLHADSAMNCERALSPFLHTVLVAFAIAVSVVACGSPSGAELHCNTCDGNVAISCERHNCDYVNPVRVNCGAQTCKVSSVDSTCTSQGSAFDEPLYSAGCE